MADLSELFVGKMKIFAVEKRLDKCMTQSVAAVTFTPIIQRGKQGYKGREIIVNVF